MSSLASRVYPVIKPVARVLYPLMYRGGGRFCPICAGRFSSFAPYGAAGTAKRPDARCPRCFTLERHRLVFRFFEEKTDLHDGRPKRLLHVAPEESLESLFRRAVGDGYHSGDLFHPRAMEKMDICDIRHDDNTFDVIYCSHVLEHVPDDRRAIAEFLRVLKPGGWAILNVPIMGDKTFEDPEVTDPKERLRVFGQSDHVRRCGPDYPDRIREVGFDVRVYKPKDIVSESDLTRLGVSTKHAGDVYYCTKPSPQATA
ncbi:MAG: methyltransferase domain-containing protein [Planctomycetota bacterium]